MNTEPSAIRAFLAVPLPAPLQREIGRLQGALAGELPGVRWSDPATIHLTLRFFGAIDGDALEKTRAIMLSIALLHQPFAAPVSRLGVFPGVRAPRVLWLGVASPPLSALQAACAAALRQAGLPGDERAFTPHLTIGRLQRRPPQLSPVLAAWSDRPAGVLPVDRLVLYQSRLLPGGARHLPLFTAPLGTGPGGIWTDQSNFLEGENHDGQRS